MSLSISLRPRKITEVFNQPTVVKDVTVRTKAQDWPTALLFKGPTGVGKTTVAQIVAMTINCSSPDTEGFPCGACPSCKSIIEERFDRDTFVLDGSTIGQKTDIVEFGNLANIAPMYDKKRILIIEEADQLSTSAKNALHKILEKPRSHVHFILLSMYDTGLPSSIQSRCQTFNFRAFSVLDIANGLKTIMESDGSWSDESIPDYFKLQGLFSLAQASRGSFRQALQYFEKCLVSKYFTAEEIQNSLGIIDDKTLSEVVTLLLNKNPEFFERFEKFDTKEFFNISYKTLSEALVYSTSKYIFPESEYFSKSIKEMSENKNLRDTILLYQDFLSKTGSYVNRSLFLSMVANNFLASAVRHPVSATLKSTDSEISQADIQRRLDAEASVRAASMKNQVITTRVPREVRD